MIKWLKRKIITVLVFMVVVIVVFYGGKGYLKSKFKPRKVVEIKVEDVSNKLGGWLGDKEEGKKVVEEVETVIDDVVEDVKDIKEEINRSTTESMDELSDVLEVLGNSGKAKWDREKKEREDRIKRASEERERSLAEFILKEEERERLEKEEERERLEKEEERLKLEQEEILEEEEMSNGD